MEFRDDFYYKINRNFVIDEIDRNVPFEQLLNIPISKDVKKFVNPSLLLKNPLSGIIFGGVGGVWNCNGRKSNKELDVTFECVNSPNLLGIKEKVDYLKQTGYSIHNEKTLENTENLRHIFYVKECVRRIIKFVGDKLEFTSERIDRYFAHESVLIQEMIFFIQLLMLINCGQKKYKPIIKVTGTRSNPGCEMWKIKFTIDKIFDFHLEAFGPHGWNKECLNHRKMHKPPMFRIEESYLKYSEMLNYFVEYKSKCNFLRQTYYFIGHSLTCR